MKYDLKAMKFDPDTRFNDSFGVNFSWSKTPEGRPYWFEHYHNPHQEGRDKIAAMLKQWKEEQAPVEPTDSLTDAQYLERLNALNSLWHLDRDTYGKRLDTPEPTRPAIDVLHQHDGSDESPLPKGTDHTFWLRGGDIEREIDRGDADWDNVTQYLVHSYPETRCVTGTVTYTNGEPDFSTWKETE